MRIIFLGTGSAINIPRNGCGCLTCRDARRPKSKSKRTNSSILIQNERASILIDATPNFISQFSTKLRKHTKVRKLDAVFLTHAHKDAAGGLKDLFKFAKKQKNQITLYIHKETFRRLKLKTKDQKPKTNIKNIKIKFIRPFRTIKLLNFRIVSFPVFHGLKRYPTFGYLIKSPSFPLYQRGIKGDLAHLNKEGLRRISSSIIYASDMDGAPKKSLRYFKKAKVLILDASMWFGKKIKGHFNVEEAIKFAQKFIAPKSRRSLGEGGKKLYLTHLGHTFPSHEKAQKKINQYLKTKKIPLAVQLAYDGMKLMETDGS